MKQCTLLVISMLFYSSPVCQAQTNNDSLFTLDLSYSLTGLYNHGWGIGLNYERKLFNHLSVKGNFSHMTFLTGINNVYCTSVHLSLFANYYPLGSGLDKSYFGIGTGCDFMNYFGSGEIPDNAEDTLVHITPQTGWKFWALDFLMIDVSVGYKILIINAENYREIENYINDGFRFGINILILFDQLKIKMQKVMTTNS